MLSNHAVKSARPGAAAYKLADGLGMHLFVAPTGTRSFRLRFRFDGKEQLLTLGTYPEIDLAEARARRDAARAQLGRGEDPRVQATSTAPATFEAAARAWLKIQAESWTPVHAGDVLTSLERDVFPAIGAAEFAAIAAADVLELLRAVERRGARETARRLRQRISAIFELAIGEGWCDSNPAAHSTRGLRKPAAVVHHPALHSVDDARALLDAVDQLAGAPVAKLASRFLALTAVRWAAVRGARWQEIEDLEGAEPIWRVPAARVKLAASKKSDVAHDHIVPLAPAAVAVLREAKMFGAGSWIFPGRRGMELGEAAVGDLYKRTDFAGRHVPHGWRATFSTAMNERFPMDRAAIDQVLGHALRAEAGGSAKVEAAYNRAQHLAARRRLLDAWAAILTD